MTCNDINYIGSKLDLIDTLCMNDNNPNYFSHNIYEIMYFSFKDKNAVYQFYNLMIIGNKLGFKREDIYKSSKNKIKVIDERLSNRY